MPTWNVPTAEAQPEITLVRWTVVRLTTPDGSIEADFVHGWDTTNDFARTSTKIVDSDRSKQIVTTMSGRRYRLQGRHGCNPESEYVFRAKFGPVLNQCRQEDGSHLYAKTRRRQPKEAKSPPAART